MSMSTTDLRPVPHDIAWDRKQTMRDVIALVASKNALRLENAPHFARTYGVSVEEVEAEMMKFQTEGGEK